MAGRSKLRQSYSRILAPSRSSRHLRLAQRWASDGKEAPFKVEVVDVQARKFPWLLLGAAASAGIGAWYLKQQKDAQKTAEEAAASAAAAATAELKAKEAKEAKAAADAAEAAALKAEAEAAARAAEAAAHQAAAEAEAEARRQAAAAKRAALEAFCLRGTQLLSEVSIIQDAAEYYSASDAENEDLHALLATLQNFLGENAFKDLEESDEKSQLASNLLSSLAFLRLFVQRLQKADAAERQFDAAASSIRAERRQWLAGEAADLFKIEDGVAQAEAALVDLQSVGMKSDVFDEIIESARLNLQEMKDEERRRNAQEVTGKALEIAMTKDPLDSKVCEQTAKDARQAGCLPTAALEIAQRVADVKRDVSIPKLYETVDTISLASDAQTERQPEDYVSAAASVKSSMSEAQLIQHISDLAEALATHHQRQVLELSGAWAEIYPKWQSRNEERELVVKEDFAKRKQLGKEAWEAELREVAARRLKEATLDAVEEVQERSERDIYDLYSSTNLQLQEDLTGAIRSFDAYFRSLPGIFTKPVQELWSQGDSPEHRVAKASHSAVSSLGGDPSLSPEELQSAFHNTLPELMAAAFEPESGFFCSLIGQVFGRLYQIKGEQVELSMREHLESKLGSLPIDDEKDVHKNLRTLAEALRLVERGEVRGALVALDGLAGQCRSRAEEWISLARQTLLSQQAADAARARMLCLRTTLEASP